MALYLYAWNACATSPPKLLDKVRDRIRVKHYSIRTEHAYVEWIKSTGLTPD